MTSAAHPMPPSLLEHRLEGRARAEAHASVMLASEGFVREGRGQFFRDHHITAILLKDPSVLLERIPESYPVENPEEGTPYWVRDNNAWSQHAYCFQTWLARVSEHMATFEKVVSTAVEFGIHPDCETAWFRGRLLDSDTWLANPERLALALKFGASPNRGATAANWNSCYLRRALENVKARISGAASVSAIDVCSAVKCAVLLLEAGTIEIDFPHESGDERASSRNALTAVGYLVVSSIASSHPTAQSTVRDLIKQLHTAGADIDRRCGALELPPVVHALRTRDIATACVLVRLGCNIDDVVIVRSEGIVIRPLMDEANAAGGAEFCAQLTGAIMQRHLDTELRGEAAEAVGAPVSEGAKPRRRKMGV
jgi:hypothetical protein